MSSYESSDAHRWSTADTVAGEEEALVRVVPERDREHPADALEEALAVLLVEVRDDLDVPDAAERVPLRLELGTQLAVVVELAVDDRYHVAALVRDRLVASLEVDDREPPHRQPGTLADPAALAVGPAVPEQLHGIERLGARVSDDAEDPAHGVLG